MVLLKGRISLPRRQLGICGAVVNGAWGGLNLIPLHYAQRDLGLTGAAYITPLVSESPLTSTLTQLPDLLSVLAFRTTCWKRRELQPRSRKRTQLSYIYQLFGAASQSDLLQELGLDGGAESFSYLGNRPAAKNQKDADAFQEIIMCLSRNGIVGDKQTSVLL